MLSDLLDALEETSGRDLASWSKEWLETAGVNTLRPLFEVGDDGALHLVRGPAGGVRRSTRRCARTASRSACTTARRGLVRRRRVELDVVGARTDVAELVGERRPDLVLVNDDDLTYAKVRLDEHSLRTLVDGIGDITEALPRALCWSAAWDMTRDAEIATRDYVRLILSGIRGVTDISVAQTLLRQARTAVQQYADPAWREDGPRPAGLRPARPADRGRGRLGLPARPTPRRSSRSRPRRSTCGSSAACSTARTTLDGLVVDTELRWTLLHRLVVRGAAGEDEIAAELQRDPTAAGERHAAADRAAIPTAEAKAAAWDRIIAGDLPNAVFRSTLGGFVDTDDTTLLEPYVEKYFAEVGRVWSSWTSDMSSTFAEVAYPFQVISQSTVDRTTEHIASERPAARAAPAADRGPRRRVPRPARAGEGPLGVVDGPVSARSHARRHGRVSGWRPRTRF